MTLKPRGFPFLFYGREPAPETTSDLRYALELASPVAFANGEDVALDEAFRSAVQKEGECTATLLFDPGARHRVLAVIVPAAPLEPTVKTEGRAEIVPRADLERSVTSDHAGPIDEDLPAGTSVACALPEGGFVALIPTLSPVRAGSMLVPMQRRVVRVSRDGSTRDYDIPVGRVHVARTLARWRSHAARSSERSLAATTGRRRRVRRGALDARGDRWLRGVPR